MASFIQKSDPWIENTFLYSCSFSNNDQHPLHYDTRDSHGYTKEYEENDNNTMHQEPSQFDSQQFECTENTIPSGLIDSQPDGLQGVVGGGIESNNNNNNSVVVTPPPSRQAKIVQIIHRGGSGWIGKSVVGKATVRGSTNRTITAAAADDGDHCPPYIILHDGKYSTVAFLSREAMESVGLDTTLFGLDRIKNHDNSGAAGEESSPIKTRTRRGRAKKTLGHKADESDAGDISDASSVTSTMSSRAERSARRAKQPLSSTAINSNKVTLRDKSLVSITHYTVSTVLQCCSSSNIHHNRVLNSLDIPSNIQKQLHNQLHSHLFLCLYLQGPITIIGGENQGLIGNSVDVHCSVRLRQLLRDHDDGGVGDERGERGGRSHETLLEKLEACHLFYQNAMKKKVGLQQQQRGSLMCWGSDVSEDVGQGRGGKKRLHGKRNNKGKTSRRKGENGSNFLVPDWPWTSRLDSVPSNITAAEHSPGNVDQLLGGGLDDMLGSHPDEYETESPSKRTAGRASTGTYLAQWDLIDSDDEEGKEEGAGNDGGEKATGDEVQQGDAAALFENVDYLDEILDFSSESEAAAETLEKSNPPDDDAEDDERDEVRNNTASFVGIDQMIVEEDSEDDDGDNGHLYTQPDAMVNDDFDEDGPFSQVPISLKSDSPKKAYDDGPESQIPIGLRKQPQKRAYTRTQRRSFPEKSTEPVNEESQIPLITRRTLRQVQSDDDDGPESQLPFGILLKQPPTASKHHVEEKPEESRNESQLPFATRRSTFAKGGEQYYDSDDSDSWMKVVPRCKGNSNLSAVQRRAAKGNNNDRSQLAGEGSEENTPTNRRGGAEAAIEVVEEDDFSPDNHAQGEELQSSHNKSRRDRDHHVSFNLEKSNPLPVSNVERASKPAVQSQSPSTSAATRVKSAKPPTRPVYGGMVPKKRKNYDMNEFFSRARRMYEC